MRFASRWLLMGLAIGCAPAAVTAPAAGGEAPRVEVFTPQGTVKQVRQVAVRFATPMVALGDPRLAKPFDIECAARGTGRWADARNWVFDFDQDLEAGVRCRFTLAKARKDLAGRTLTGERSFAFDTGGPAIVASFPHEGSVVDEDQVFLARLDAPATLASVNAHAHCAVQGIGERIPVKVLSGAERAAVLAQRDALGYAYYHLLLKDGSRAYARVPDPALEQAEGAIVALQCLRRLPPGAEVRLIWGAGIATESGMATEDAQQLAFRVRPAFTARVECSRVNARAGCIPIEPIVVRFTAPVPRESALGIRLRTAAGAAIAPAPPPAGQAPTVEEVVFAGPFPALESLSVELPARVVDDAGRALENAERFPLELRIDEYPPLARFAAEFGILEAREGGVLPVTLRNVEAKLPARQTALPGRTLRIEGDGAAVVAWLRRVREANAPRGEWVHDARENRSVWRESTGAQSVFAAEHAAREFAVEKPAGEKPAEVIGISLGEPGFYVVELESRRLGAALLGRDVSRYVSAAALVTNLAVHFKWGRESSRVWVTRLHDGAPVDAAELAVVDVCSGAERWRGRTGKDGVASIAQSLGQPHGNPECTRWSDAPLIVVARVAEDFSFALSHWSDGISPYDFGLPAGFGTDAGLWHTVFDRPLFRAGETVAMKHFLRRHVGEGIRTDGDAPREARVTISHLGSGQRYEAKVGFGADGIAEQRWGIPSEAKLGEYVVQVRAGDVERHTGRFKVEEFRLPTMRATVQGSPHSLVRPRSVDLDLYVAYLSGGGASALPVKLRSVVEPLYVSFPDYPDFQFGGAPVREGVVRLGDSDGERSDIAKAQVLPLTLDAQGGSRATVQVPGEVTAPAQLIAELEYADANGEILSATGRVRLLPSAVTLGIRRENWVASSDQLRFQVLALDKAGQPLSRQRVSVQLYQSNAYSYRKRLLGGFYAYETVRETKKLPARCEGLTDGRGIFACEVAPAVSGEVVLRAEARDAGGHLTGATASIWVAGEDDWWFGGTTGDRMDVLPEKKEYEAGDTARFQVRMPFRAATALVTVEREGVLRSYVRRLRGRSPVIEVPIENAFAPNVYVSVLAVRGRVGRSDRTAVAAGELTGIVDLNRPAYRLGIAQVRVGWKPHRLKVSVLPERDTYRVREQAQVRVRVQTEDGRPLPRHAEIALAAVDEALLDLAPNGSWQLLEAMMRERGIEVYTSTAQMQVVGKRHYGRKAVPHGGGGGRERARDLFDSLLLWQPRVRLDAQGEARIAVPLNDSLTSFRIAAVAHAGDDRFGTGSASIATTQDIMLLSGLPPLVREGDRYAATFTVRNASRGDLQVKVSATLAPAGQALDDRLIDIPAGETRDVVWAVLAPVGTKSMRWDVTAAAAAVEGEARDRLSLSNKVIAAHPVRTWQATLAQLDVPLRMTAERPKDSVAGRGGLEITLRARLGEGLDGVREYMSFYPYTCLEQSLSKAVALRDRAMWDAWMQRLPAYTDRDGLLRYFPSEHLPGEDVLTSYVLAIAHEANWEIPPAQRESLLRALAAFVDGRIVRRSALPTADLTVRKIAAIDALARHGAAQPGQLDSLTIEPNLWPTSAVIDWHGILTRVKGIPRAAERRAAAETILRSRLNFQGTTMGFSTERGDALWWLMISTDSNAVRMLLAVLAEPAWRPDVPRLVRGALGRQQRGHWSTTVANAWGVLAMEKFSAAFEDTPVTGVTTTRYAAKSTSIAWPAGKPQDKISEKRVDWPWTEGARQLEIRHEGTGKPWAMVRATAALPLREPFSSGFKVNRTLTPIEQRVAGRWSRGDVVRVRLELEAQSDMTWVVVDDPVPAGATILGSGLGGRSDLLTRDEQREGWAWSAFEERRFEAFRAYYRFVPKGAWTVEYTVRLNNPGTFVLPATRVEAMYAPEMLGESPNPDLTVEPAP